MIFRINSQAKTEHRCQVLMENGNIVLQTTPQNFLLDWQYCQPVPEGAVTGSPYPMALEINLDKFEAKKRENLQRSMLRSVYLASHLKSKIGMLAMEQQLHVMVIIKTSWVRSASMCT
jgi:hypothetical protein